MLVQNCHWVESKWHNLLLVSGMAWEKQVYRLGRTCDAVDCERLIGVAGTSSLPRITIAPLLPMPAKRKRFHVALGSDRFLHVAVPSHLGV